MKTSKLLTAVTAGVIAGGLLTGFWTYTAMKEKVNTDAVVATIGKEQIKESDLYKKMVVTYGNETLETIINERLIDLEITSKNIKVTKEDIQKEIDGLVEQYGGKEVLDNQLKQSGTTEEKLKHDITKFLQMKQIYKEVVPVTEQEIESFYQEHKTELATKEQVKASHILVEDEETANEVYQKLQEGKDFSALAKEYSTDKANSEVGGDLGYFTRGAMVDEFDDVAFKTGVGEMSKPFKSNYGYHILKVTGKKAGKEATLDKEMKEHIEAIIQEQKLESKYPDYIKGLKEKYNVKVNLNS